MFLSKERKYMRKLILIVLLMITPVSYATETPDATEVSMMSSIRHIAESILNSILPPIIQIPANVPEREIKCLADNIYFEAKNEPLEGQLAVAKVTLNRVDHPHYPKTVCGVVWQHAQFSWTKDGKSDIPDSKLIYSEIYSLAEEILLYDMGTDIISSDALYFHAVYIKPKWARKMRNPKRIGNHVFYEAK